MSQHSFATIHHGNAVEILMGWDRAMQVFFMTVEQVKAWRGTHDDVPLYSSLDDPAATSPWGGAFDLRYYQRKLKELGLQVPARMLQEIYEDRDGNVGNRYVRYDAAGVCSDTPS